jgi:hypothetical protein
MKLTNFIAGVCTTLAIEAALAVAVVYGAWKYETQR